MRWEHERALQALAELADDAARDGPRVRGGDRRPGSPPRRAARVRRGALVLDDGARPGAWRSPRSRSRRGTRLRPKGIALVPYAADWKEATRLARNDAFRDHWGSLETPAERWSHFVDGPHLRPDLSWLAVEGDRVVALALGTVNEDDWEAQGYSSVYIDLIGVTRDRRGRRLAPAVITALLRSARDAGLDKAVLDVDTESPTGANSLYGRLGFEPTERRWSRVVHALSAGVSPRPAASSTR